MSKIKVGKKYIGKIDGSVLEVIGNKKQRMVYITAQGTKVLSKVMTAQVGIVKNFQNTHNQRNYKMWQKIKWWIKYRRCWWYEYLSNEQRLFKRKVKR